MMKINGIFTKIASKNAQMALKHPENEVLLNLSKIRFAIVLNPKIHLKSKKSASNFRAEIRSRFLSHFAQFLLLQTMKIYVFT